MTTLQTSSSLFRSFVLTLCLFIIPSVSSDSDPLQDFCVGDLNGSPSINGFPCKSAISASDFFFSGFGGGPSYISSPNGAIASPVNVLNFPGLNTLGISMNNVEIAPGGVNPPHTHPRASEIGTVIEGSVLVGFLTTNNTLFSKVLNARDVFIIPRGLVHFEQNVGEVKVRLITALNSQLPGVLLLPNTLFGSSPEIPNAVLTRVLRTDDATVNNLKSKFAV